jgi:hypothetical protein
MSRSTREGVRTARVTPPQTLCVAVGVHSTRALGCTSKPEYVLCSNLTPPDTLRRRGTTDTVSCAKALNMFSVCACGVKSEKA